MGIEASEHSLSVGWTECGGDEGGCIVVQFFAGRLQVRWAVSSDRRPAAAGPAKSQKNNIRWRVKCMFPFPLNTLYSSPFVRRFLLHTRSWSMAWVISIRAAPT